MSVHKYAIIGLLKTLGAIGLIVTIYVAFLSNITLLRFAVTLMVPFAIWYTYDVMACIKKFHFNK